MIRNIKISAVLNGFVVTIGCQQIVYTSIEKMGVELMAYVRDPEKFEKAFLVEQGINRKHTLPVEEYAPPQPAPSRPGSGLLGGVVGRVTTARVGSESDGAQELAQPGQVLEPRDEVPQTGRVAAQQATQAGLPSYMVPIS